MTGSSSQNEVVEYSVVLFSDEGKSQPGKVQIRNYTLSQRRLRALKFLGIFWGAALFSVLIPLAHFFLVPAFLILGILFPLSVYGKKSVVLGGNGTCPHCQAQFDIVRMAEHWPLSDQCGVCRRKTRIEKNCN